jgi:hypothetical protein
MRAIKGLPKEDIHRLQARYSDNKVHGSQKPKDKNYFLTEDDFQKS